MPVVTKTIRDGNGETFSMRFWQAGDGTLSPLHAVSSAAGESLPVQVNGSNAEDPNGVLSPSLSPDDGGLGVLRVVDAAPWAYNSDSQRLKTEANVVGALKLHLQSSAPEGIAQSGNKTVQLTGLTGSSIALGLFTTNGEAVEFTLVTVGRTVGGGLKCGEERFDAKSVQSNQGTNWVVPIFSPSMDLVITHNKAYTVNVLVSVCERFT